MDVVCVVINFLLFYSDIFSLLNVIYYGEFITNLRNLYPG